MKLQSQAGQISVSILLIMSVLVVISFSLARRTTTEVGLTTQTTESAYVFNAAESGVNNALALIYAKLEAGEAVDEVTDETIDADENVAVSYSIRPSNQIETRLMEGNSLTIELDPANPVDVYIDWAKKEDCNEQASILVTIFSQSAGETVARYFPVGPGDGCGHDGDEFETPAEGQNDYQLRYTLSGLTANDLLVRVKAVYHDTNLLVTGSGAGGTTLPVQSYVAESRATNRLGDKQETRALRVVRTKAVAPAIMDYAVYTEGSLSK